MRGANLLNMAGLAGLLATGLVGAAAAELPLHIGLETRTETDLGRLLRDAGYPDESQSAIVGAIVGAVHEDRQPAVHAFRFTDPGVPFVNARSRVSGRCRRVEALIWFPDGAQPPLRLSGRYCEEVTPGVAHIWRATSQRVTPMGEGTPLPSVIPPAGAIVSGL
jgi:hypothetical protein